MADFEVVDLKDSAGIHIRSIIEVDGERVCNCSNPNEVAANIVHDVVNMKLQDDDIMLCTPLKSGTHWGFEIISMLLNGKAETIQIPKEFTMLEATPQSKLEEVNSPRVLNSHLGLQWLPRELKEKRTKIVLILRNPKDMSVSYYHHLKGIKLYEYDGKFEDYLPLFATGELEYGDWFDYILEFEREINKGDYNIHLTYFEELKENGLEEIKKISEFLGVPTNNELCEAICDKCRFDRMAVEKKEKGDWVEKVFRKNFTMYRKGKIGDWKNYYTVAMSEEFDELYDKRMKKSNLKFRFAPSR